MNGESSTQAQAPPLPPRKQATEPTALRPEASNRTPATSRQPPPLPARKPTPTPLTPAQDPDGGQGATEVNGTPAVAVTPATPVSRKASEDEKLGPSSPTPSAGPAKASASPPANPLTATNEVTKWTPPADVIVVTILLLNFWWISSSKLWVVSLGIAYAVFRHQQGVQAQAGMLRAENPDSATPGNTGRSGSDATAVEWVNHTLYALFPLVSTDVLTPFIDLLEDALIQQCPPIVTSVRLTSASLGAQPVLLTSLKPLSDEQWFESLTPPRDAKSSKKERDPGSSTSEGRPSLERNKSTASRLGGRSRASSNATMNTLGTTDAKNESERRRKRDRILQGLSRARRKRSTEHFLDADGMVSANRPDANNITLHPEDAEGENALPNEEDIDAERYVNYQVGFSYDRPEALKKKGWGLHALAYMGWGIKGIGKSEIPVYIDVLSVKGTVNLRLLLSATPPFVRTATFSFPHLPVVDLSAVPMRKSGFDAMGLPGMKSYVQASIADVVSGFVRPNSYTLDLERLLVGRESSLRTSSIGVLQIVLHRAQGLRRTDTIGSSDPYVVVSYSKFNKPLYSTRTIVGTQHPSWEETAFLLVTSDAVQSGERLRLRVVDSDRFSSDDALGTVEEDLADIVARAEEATGVTPFIRRTSELQADRPGMRASGSLDWSVRFCPLWEMPQDELLRRMAKAREQRRGEPGPGSGEQPWWMKWANMLFEGPEWEHERSKRRAETISWFTGEKEREELEASMRPPEDMRSGVLLFHIHQADDLEVEDLHGTFSSPTRKSHDFSAAGGKPALSEIIDRTPAENTDPPSAYCEVHLNDRLVFRTRTKQVTPSPYFNAASERFVGDWKMAKIVFVVRDERNLEHDAILGAVSMRLVDVLANRSQFTRWFPLVGGLGWGRIRLSLLFKPIEIDLPKRISGFEVATLSIKGLSATSLQASSKSLCATIQTEADSFELDNPDEVDDAPTSGIGLADQAGVGPGPDSPMTMATRHQRNLSGGGSLKSSTQTSFDFSTGSAVDVEWEIIKPIRLAVEYRHSCNLIITFANKSAVRRKRKVRGIACVRLNEMPDGEDHEISAPIFDTDDLRVAVKAYNELKWASDPSPSDPDEFDGGEQEPMRPLTPNSGKSGKSGKSAARAEDTPIIGFVNLRMKLHPGISKAHRKLCKKDLRFTKAFEAWELCKEVDKGWDKINSRDLMRVAKDEAGQKPNETTVGASNVLGDGEPAVHRQALGDDVSDSEEDEEDDDEDLEEEADGIEGSGTADGGVAQGSRRPVKQSSLDEDDGKGGIFAEARAHSRALHKRNKGVFQLKIARTGKFVVDKFQAKALVGQKNARRARGADMDVEHEGQSHL